MKLKYFITWLPGIPIAIINGSIRQYYFRNYMRELSANQLSVLSFIILFAIYVWYILPWLKLSSVREAFHTGIIWISYTVIFEFIFGHFVMKHSWEKLFYEYNILEGRLWIIILLWILLSPPTIYRIKKL